MLVPYRTQSEIDKYEPKRFGLIKKPGRNPWRIFPVFLEIFIEIIKDIKTAITRHRCDYPTRSKRFWHWIKGIPFGTGSVYRCNCGKLWEFHNNGKWDCESDHYWAMAAWTRAGGEE